MHGGNDDEYLRTKYTRKTSKYGIFERIYSCPKRWIYDKIGYIKQVLRMANRREGTMILKG